MKARVLLADDEMYFRFAAGLALHRRGHSVTEARDGEEAFSLICSAADGGEPFDLLVTDVQMPPLGGVELIDRLRARGVDIPVLVLSGYFDESLFAELARRRCLDFLEKPLSLEELVERVDQLLEGRQAQGARRR